MTEPLLLEHHPLDHYCGRCFHTYLAYEDKQCPRCGKSWEGRTKMVYPVTSGEFIVGRCTFLAWEEVVADEDARCFEALKSFAEGAPT
jgi:hypothetical protein